MNNSGFIVHISIDGADYRGKRSVVEDWRLCKVYDNDDDADDSTFKQQPAPNKPLLEVRKIE